MVSIIWKSFAFGDLFGWSSRKDLSLKNYNFIDHYEQGYVEVVTGSMNSEENKYIKIDDLPENYPVYDKCLSINTNGSIGHCFYYDNAIISPTSSVHILIHKIDKLKNKMNDKINKYFANQISNIFINGLYGYTYLIDNDKFDREIILLPLLETTREESIWEFDGKFYTLAVEYIEKLINKAKDNIEKRTINSYKQQKDEQIAQSLIYKDSYSNQIDSVNWKSFKVGELFVESTEHYLEKSKKNYNISETKDEEYCVAVCAASKVNNGIVGYINEVDDVPIKKRKGYLTKGGFGHVFYQDDWFIKPGGSWGMLNILKFRDDKIKSVFDSNTTLYKFMAKILTKLFTQICSWGYSSPIDREIILLPLLETTREESIWEFDGKYYTLAVDVISYLYYVGRVNMYDNKIKNYKCVY